MLFVFGIFGFKYFSTKVTNSPQNKKPSVTSAANSDLLEEAEEENETLEDAIKNSDEPLVLKKVMEMNFKDDENALLHAYCDTIKFPLVKGYLEDKYSVVGRANAKVEGLTIKKACKKNNLLAVKIFVLIRKVDVNAIDKDGSTALHLASYYGHINIVKFLAENGCDINAKDENELTALHLASGKGHIEVVKFLVDKKCAINAKDKDGKTALHLASGYGHIEVVKFLAENGCDVNAIDKDGKTALNLASYHAYNKVAEYLRSLPS